MMYIVFHKGVYTNSYGSTENKKYITLYGVRDVIQTSMTVVYEREMMVYNPVLQRIDYREASALYHVFLNKLHLLHDLIGFSQYDMKFGNWVDSIEPDAINHIGLMPEWGFLGGQTVLIQNYPTSLAGLTHYNEFFSTQFTPMDLLRTRMIHGNTFVISSKRFEKMMSWLMHYFLVTCGPGVDEATGIPFLPAHAIEGLTGMFLAIEVLRGAKYNRMDIHSDNSLKM